MASLKAVFWDVDGTIADTELEGHRVAFNLAFAEFNLKWQWDKNLYSKLLNIQGGVNRISWYAKHVGKELSSKLPKDIHKRKQEFYLKRIKSGLVPFRIGTKRLIDELSTKGIKQWIVTSSSLNSVVGLLQTNYPKGDSPFEGMITAEDVELYKPNPEPYLQAIFKSGVNNENIIVIEDSLCKQDYEG